MRFEKGQARRKLPAYTSTVGYVHLKQPDGMRIVLQAMPGADLHRASALNKELKDRGVSRPLYFIYDTRNNELLLIPTPTKRTDVVVTLTTLRRL